MLDVDELLNSLTPEQMTERWAAEIADWHEVIERDVVPYFNARFAELRSDLQNSTVWIQATLAMRDAMDSEFSKPEDFLPNSKKRASRQRRISPEEEVIHARNRAARQS